jgi:hypothetical protein
LAIEYGVALVFLGVGQPVHPRSLRLLKNVFVTCRFNVPIRR